MNGDLFGLHIAQSIAKQCAPYISSISALPFAERVRVINELRAMIHAVSPFASEPVDFVRWVPSSVVYANDTNAI